MSNLPHNPQRPKMSLYLNLNTRRAIDKLVEKEKQAGSGITSAQKWVESRVIAAVQDARAPQ